MINKIYFTNYKSFKEKQCLELKPMTILIGKNSSGKSAVAKLPTLIEGSLSGEFDDPLLVKNKEVELGAEFRDLIYGRQPGSLELTLEDEANKLAIEVASGASETDLPKIRKWGWNENELSFSYKDREGQYYNDTKGEPGNVHFRGFLLASGLSYPSIELKTRYIGPFRAMPQRSYTSNGSTRISDIGIKGQLAYKELIRDYLYSGGQLLNKVSEWYQTNFSGWGLQVNSQARPDYKIELARTNPKFSINIVDVGEGMTQALPLVVSALMENEQETLTILEQPELHLHPAAHGNLAELFATQSKDANKKFLIETHSQNFVLRLRRMIAEERFNKDDLIIYFVDYDEENNTSNLREIKVDELGRVSHWPKDVFNETLDETIAIRTAQLNKEKDVD